MSRNLTATLALQRSADFAIDIAIDCPPGITCLMGPSGSGKTTLLSAVAGLLPADRGRIALGDTVWFERTNGKPSVDVPVHDRKLAYVFQSLALFPHMTARANVEYALVDESADACHKRALSLLRRVGVEHLAERKPRTFSGGEAQRVAIARALAREPELVLLDEPFSALDRDLRAQLCDLVRELSRELNVPILHVTHSHQEAESLADRILSIERGKLVV